MRNHFTESVKALKKDIPKSPMIPGAGVLRTSSRKFERGCIRGLVRDLDYLTLYQEFDYNPDDKEVSALIGDVVYDLLFMLYNIISLSLSFGIELEDFWDDFIKYHVKGNAFWTEELSENPSRESESEEA